MQKSVLVWVFVLAIFTGAYAHSGEHGGSTRFTKHFNETLFAISEKGQMSIEVLLDEKEYKIGKDVIGIVVHDSNDEDVEGAKLEVTVAGSTEPLKVTEKGGGLYLAPAAGLSKDGKWELKVFVKTKKLDDGAAFSYPAMMKTTPPAGKYSADVLKEKK